MWICRQSFQIKFEIALASFRAAKIYLSSNKFVSSCKRRENLSPARTPSAAGTNLLVSVGVCCWCFRVENFACSVCVRAQEPEKFGDCICITLRTRKRAHCTIKQRFPRLRYMHRDLRNTQCKSYLVDPASSHTLVSKIKPCMYKFMPLVIGRNREWLIKTVIIYLILKVIWITVVILELIHAPNRQLQGNLQKPGVY